jgi:hypothetical protein
MSEREQQPFPQHHPRPLHRHGRCCYREALHSSSPSVRGLFYLVDSFCSCFGCGSVTVESPYTGAPFTPPGGNPREGATCTNRNQSFSTSEFPRMYASSSHAWRNGAAIPWPRSPGRCFASDSSANNAARRPAATRRRAPLPPDLSATVAVRSLINDLTMTPGTPVAGRDNGPAWRLHHLALRKPPCLRKVPRTFLGLRTNSDFHGQRL